jgi:two-component system, NarL family, sensor histidine kinase UhpB
VWLHDEIGQMLTRARLDAMLLDGLPGTAEGSGAQTLQSLKQTLDDAVVGIRNISMDLRPAILDDFGLSAALEWSLAQDEKRLKIPVKYESEGVPEHLDADLAVGFYRMARECMMNVARHAGARQVEVSLSTSETHLALVVRDDGVGMDPRLLDDPASFGLGQLRERAHALGGGVVVESGPELGTTVRIHAPLPRRRQGGQP